MADPMGSTDDAALWRRWRYASASADSPGVEPDEMTLAAYAEGRLDAAALEAVEDWLAVNPQAVQDIVAARQAGAALAMAVPAAVVERASALVAGGSGTVLPFRRRASADWRATAAWAAMAASIVVASLAGFEMGNSTYATLAGRSTVSFGQELLDPPTGLFSGADEDSNI